MIPAPIDPVSLEPTGRLGPQDFIFPGYCRRCGHAWEEHEAPEGMKEPQFCITKGCICPCYAEAA